MITIGTDCSGIEAPLQALNQLKVPYKQLWSCDIDKYTRMSCEANYPKPEKVYTDMITRNNKELPRIDLYVCGFPCQSFSLAGRRLGLDDPRPSVISSMLDTISKTKPKIIILENVSGFKSIDSGKPYKILTELLSKEYCLDASIYNTKDYGLPQNRKRIYFVGIRKDIQKKSFVKPLPVKMKSFESIIDSSIVGTIIPDMYFKNIHKIKENTKILVPWNYYNPMGLISPTLTTQCSYFFLIKQKRVLTNKELLAIQGFSKNFRIVVNRGQITKQIGNAMSVCVVKKIIKEALLCI
jgi:DNA (cytosine-5)-methyltransferase 1